MMQINEMRIIALLGSAVIFGSERGNLEVLAALRDKGAKVLILMSDADFAEDAREYVRSRGFDIETSPYFIPPREHYRINPWIDLPIKMLQASARLLSVSRVFRPTHLQAGNQASVLNFLPGLFLLKTPLVYRCGDAPVTHNLVWRASWRFISRRAARFVAVSRYIAELMMEAGVSKEKLSVIYSRPPSRGPMRMAPARRNQFNIVYMGQINANKGVDVLIDAFRNVSKDFPNARLRIAGRVSDWVGDQWAWDLRERTLGDPQLAERVDFLGYVEDIPGLLSSCALHVAPTLTEEPMGNTVMEAKQAGLPSVIFRSGGFPEVIEHGVDGHVCDEKSSAALEVGLRVYLDDPARARRQGAAARASLISLGVEAFATKWEAVYAEASDVR